MQKQTSDSTYSAFPCRNSSVLLLSSSDWSSLLFLGHFSIPIFKQIEHLCFTSTSSKNQPWMSHFVHGYMLLALAFPKARFCAWFGVPVQQKNNSHVVQDYSWSLFEKVSNNWSIHEICSYLACSYVFLFISWTIMHFEKLLSIK